MAYAYTNKKGTKYYLHSKEITLRGGNKKQMIYYFKKSEDNNAVNDIPQGYKVAENKRTGLPYLEKNK